MSTLLKVEKVLLDPNNDYREVNPTTVIRDGNGKPFLRNGNIVTPLVDSFRVEGSQRPVWTKRIKEANIDLSKGSITLEPANEDLFFYKKSEFEKPTQVQTKDILVGEKGRYYTIIDGVLQYLFRRSVDVIFVDGVKFSKYEYDKIFGFGTEGQS